MLKSIQYFLIVFLFWGDVSALENNTVLDQFLNGLDTFTGEFEQSLVDVDGEVLDTTKGTLYLKYPGQFHWQYTEPYKQSLITDGVTLWVYDEDLEQVTIKEIKNELDNTPAAILSGSDNLHKHFDVVDKGSVEEIALIELNPRDEQNQFHSIRLGFEKNNLVLMVMFDKLGQITRVDFTNTHRNKKLEDDLFTFTVPEGVDVIDGREQDSTL